MRALVLHDLTGPEALHVEELVLGEPRLSGKPVAVLA